MYEEGRKSEESLRTCAKYLQFRIQPEIDRVVNKLEKWHVK